MFVGSESDAFPLDEHNDEPSPQAEHAYCLRYGRRLDALTQRTMRSRLKGRSVHGCTPRFRAGMTADFL